MGAFLNVQINVKELEDAEAAAGYLERGAAIQQQAMAHEAEILTVVAEKMASG